MENEISVLDYIRVVLKNKYIIIGLALVLAFSFLVYNLTKPKLYKATASLMIVETSGGGLASALTAVPFLSGGIAKGSEARLMPIVRSNALALDVLSSLSPEEYFPELAQSTNYKPKEKEQIMAEALQGAVEPEISEGLFKIAVAWTDPVKAAKLSNLYVSSLGRFLNLRSMNINFQVIDQALPPKNPFKPKVKRSAILGGFLGLFLGIFYSFFLEYFNKLRHQL